MATSSPAKTMNKVLLGQFYWDKSDELLPIVITDLANDKGIDRFVGTFCDLWAKQPGQEKGILVTRQQVKPAFTTYFDDHLKFYEMAKKAHEAVGEGITDNDLEAFYEIIKDSPGYKSIMKSTNLDGKQRRIICRMMMPKAVDNTVKSSQFFTEMFEEEEPTKAEVVVVPAPTVEPVKGKTGPEPGSKAKTPERGKALAIINKMVYETKDNVFPTNMAIRDAIVEEHPELSEWVVDKDNRDWISKRLSVYIIRFREKESLPKPGDDNVIVYRSKAKRNPEQKKAWKVIEKLQGKPHYYSGEEMRTHIRTKYPELSEWLEVSENKKWVLNQVGNIKRSMEMQKSRGATIPGISATSTPKPVISKPVAPKPEPVVAPVVPPVVTEPPPSPKKEELSVAEDLISRLESFTKEMKSGSMTPVEVLRKGAKLEQEKHDFSLKFMKIEQAFEEGLSKYKELGIEI